ncbi:MAG: AbrB/MazE/SpoVT family DNA-binding domain-containing protein [Deltaproteobacteria bacterium]|nr:AbrB/MazE/SpoVT family DNA-binding domain-containing protein [Deltaproteobacteria bacterium]MBI3389823.1 AbrB/MazE/SpoVT family DNA-binding domain-containing protein [Deltaproteobacteria bacterium]
MRSQVAKWGDSLAVRIPKAIAREAGLVPGTTVQMTAAEGRVLIAPAAPHYNLRGLVTRITSKNRHRETDWSLTELVLAEVTAKLRPLLGV